MLKISFKLDCYRQVRVTPLDWDLQLPTQRPNSASGSSAKESQRFLQFLHSLSRHQPRTLSEQREEISQYLKPEVGDGETVAPILPWDLCKLQADFICETGQEGFSPSCWSPCTPISSDVIQMDTQFSRAGAGGAVAPNHIHKHLLTQLPTL